ncbi:MAG: alginate O-acetyltransferase AlgX-related protein [Nitrospiraceae bacterium]
MEANQVPFEDSFASLLELELKGKVPGTIEVVNASVSGWGTDDELTYLMRYGFQFQPDLVLLGVTLHNDIQDNLAQEFHSYVNGELQEKPRQDIPTVDYVTLQIKEFLASHSHLYQMILRGKNSSWAQREGRRLSSHVAALLSNEGPDEAVRRGWDMTRLLLRKMKVETEKRGIDLILFMIPLWVQVSEEQLSFFLAKHQLSLTQIALDKPQLRLKEIGNQESLQTIDLLEVFRTAEQKDPGKLYLLGDGHWTAAGQYLAAKFVSERLTSRRHNQ